MIQGLAPESLDFDKKGADADLFEQRPPIIYAEATENTRLFIFGFLAPLVC